jgi:uncharacterized protein
LIRVSDNFLDLVGFGLLRGATSLYFSNTLLLVVTLTGMAVLRGFEKQSHPLGDKKRIGKGPTFYRRKGMNWKIPLPQVGNGCSFTVGPYREPTKFKPTALHVHDHPWLQEIFNELGLSVEDAHENFSLSVSVEKQSEAYRVTAHVNMIPQLECVRSLTLFRSAIEAENEAIFVRAVENSNNRTGEHELSESELDSYEHDGQGLILSTFLTDFILTSLPDFPLCQSDCKGLCSECGCNLNEARTCGHNKSSESEFSCPNIQLFN